MWAPPHRSSWSLLASPVILLHLRLAFVGNTSVSACTAHYDAHGRWSIRVTSGQDREPFAVAEVEAYSSSGARLTGANPTASSSQNPNRPASLVADGRHDTYTESILSRTGSYVEVFFPQEVATIDVVAPQGCCQGALSEALVELMYCGMPVWQARAAAGGAARLTYRGTDQAATAACSPSANQRWTGTRLHVDTSIDTWLECAWLCHSHASCGFWRVFPSSPICILSSGAPGQMEGSPGVTSGYRCTAQTGVAVTTAAPVPAATTVVATTAAATTVAAPATTGTASTTTATATASTTSTASTTTTVSVTTATTTVTVSTTDTTVASTTRTSTTLTSTSTASSTTTTSLSSTATTLTTSTTTTMTGSFMRAVAAANGAVRASQQVAAQLLGGGGVVVEQDTALGVVHAFNLTAALEKGSSATLAARAGRVVVSQGFAGALPDGAVLAVLQAEEGKGDGEVLAAVARDSGQSLAATAVEISVFDGRGSHVPQPSTAAPLLFKLPNSQGLPPEATCAFLDVSGPVPRWSTRGVRRARDDEVRALGEEPAGVWCWTEHLSFFSVILQVLLGCTNAELLSPDGFAAITLNEGWHSAESAMIVFALGAVLTLAMMLGVLWECWQFRLGKISDAGKTVHCCGRVVQWGPQVVKHRYAAFVVYARDVLQCMAAGRAKLKISVLTQSVQRFLAVRTGISIACVSQYCWNGGGWIDSRAAVPKIVLCRKLELYGGGAERAIGDLCVAGWRQAPRRFLLTALAIHPVLDAMRVGAGSMTVAKRTFMQASSVAGVIATNALIFSFSGSLRSWEAEATCFIEPTSRFFVIIATVASIIVNVFPNAFLLNLAKQVYGRPLWNLGCWLLMCSYLGLACLVIILGLANLNPKDQGKWYASLEWSMAIKFLGMPFAQALRHFMMLEVFLREDSKSRPSEQFRTVMGLKHPREVELSQEQQEAVEAMAMAAISIEELLDFYCMLGDKVMPEFDPATSTSEDVLQKAIHELCVKVTPEHSDQVIAHFTSTTSYVQGGQSPPDRTVVHCRRGKFLHLVSTVLADAMASQTAYAEVEAFLLSRDFVGLLAALDDAGCRGTRYWIEMFAMDPSALRKHEAAGDWQHERLLASLPTILRSIRRASSRKMIRDLKSSKRRNPTTGPLKQLLVMDRNYHFMHEASCLSEMMVARAMRVRQTVALHPHHLRGGDLGDQLKRLAQELAAALSEREQPWTAPYLEDRQAVYDAVKDLVVASVKEQKEDEESTWQDLHMTDIATSIGATAAMSHHAARDEADVAAAGGAGDIGAMDDGGGDAAGD